MGNNCICQKPNQGELDDSSPIAQISTQEATVVSDTCYQPPVEKLENIIILTDSYKVTHHLQYPPETSTIYSYFESRGGLFDEVCFFGLQYFIKRYLCGQVVTRDKIDEAERYVKQHFADPDQESVAQLFNRAGWEYIADKLGGKLPIVIKAVPEGTVLPGKNVLFTMENTDKKCYWLTNYLESLLVQVWYPMTVSTQSLEQKKILTKYLKETGSPEVSDGIGVKFKLHDFGFRGVSSVESAGLGGAGHLVHFLGSDTMAALMLARRYYGESCAGFSIPASEHSTMTSWGKDKECDAMRNMLTVYDKGLVACVSDSYDIFNACEKYWGTELKATIEARDGQLVVRPDSGELPGIVLQVLEKLEGKFGSENTSTGHKLLPKCIRVIQGDGIDMNSLEKILAAMKDKGWAADNLVFGSGGALLQKMHRDTLKCAFKCSYAKVKDEDVDVVKDPITDPGKKSKKGRLTLERDGNTWTTVTEGKGDPDKDQLQVVFRDGDLIIDQTFAEIRARASGEEAAAAKPEDDAGTASQEPEPILLEKDQLEDTTGGDQWQRAEKSGALETAVSKIEVSVEELKDQESGTAKGKLGLALYDEAGALAARCEIFGTYREEGYSYGSSPSRTLDKDQEVVSKAKPGFVYHLEYVVGAGTGQQLSVKGWKCKIFPFVELPKFPGTYTDKEGNRISIAADCSKIKFSSGKEIPCKAVDDNTIEISGKAMSYSGTMCTNGSIKWSDGDMWKRAEEEPKVTQSWTVIHKKGMNVRKGPSTNAEVIGLKEFNAEIRGVVEGDWVVLSGDLGYVLLQSNGKQYLTPTASPVDTEDPFGNIVLLTDSYKVTHHLQYPPGTEVVYSYFECRGGAYEDVCFFGLQYFLKRYMCGPVVTTDKINAAASFVEPHFTSPDYGLNDKLFNREAWEYIVTEHRGHLPVVIKAVPEGTVLPVKNVLFTMENTDPKCYWLTNYLETLLVQVWYTTTVCTQSREQKNVIVQYLKETGSPKAVEAGGHLFKLHDFGFRGVSSVESAALGGASHLVHFRGTDTLAGIVMLKEYYGAACAGFSIPASEHSTMTSWGKDKELDAMRNMLEVYPTGVVACVSDSYDIWNACENYWGTELKEMIEKRKGVLVVRPDSGKLPDIVIKVLEKLQGKFGHSVTSTGHKLLPSCIRVIQGDGIDITSLKMVLEAMKNQGWAADNLAFGSGGALLQKVHRDVQKCAFKCSYAEVNGEGVDVIKDPVTDQGKRSKKGRLTLEQDEKTWKTVQEGQGDPDKDVLREVFRDGKLVVDDDFDTIRKRAEQVLL